MTSRLARMAPALVFVAVSILYVATTAPGLTWAHGGAAGGDLVAAAYTLGIPHPTGYPTFVLLGKLFTLLPYGGVAWRLHLLSALAGAGAVALVAATARRLLATVEPREALPAALTAAGLLATGRLLWSQAVIAEVHALNAFWAALALYLAVRVAQRPSARALGLVGLALGLGLGNEQTLGLLVPSLVVLAWPGLRQLPRLAWLDGLAGLAVGLAVYLYLPLRASQGPRLAWGQPGDLQGFLWHVSGAASRYQVFALPASALPERLWAWVGMAAAQFTWPGLGLAVAGLVHWWQHDGRLFAASSLGAGLYLAYALGYDTPQAHVYLLPALLLATRGLAEGARLLAASLRRHLPALPVAGLALLLVAVALAVNAPAVSLRGDRAAESYARAALRHLPTDAVICSAADAHTYALWYAQWVLGPRPRWAVVDTRLLGHPWYRQALRRDHPDLALPDPTAADPAQALLAANRKWRPVYLADPVPVPPPELISTGQWGLDDPPRH